MASPPPTVSPLSEREIRESFRSYQQALSSLTPESLMAELGRVNALLEAQSSNLLTSRLWQESHSRIDTLDQAQEPTWMSPSDQAPDRPTSPLSPPTQPSAISLLAGTGRLGPKMAAKLVLSSARAQSRRMGR